MRNTSHASRISNSSSPLVSLWNCPFFVDNLQFKSKYKQNWSFQFYQGFWLLEYPVWIQNCSQLLHRNMVFSPWSNWLRAPPTRGVRRPPSCPSPSCCPSPRATALSRTDLHTALTPWYEPHHTVSIRLHCPGPSSCQGIVWVEINLCSWTLVGPSDSISSCFAGSQCVVIRYHHGAICHTCHRAQMKTGRFSGWICLRVAHSHLRAQYKHTLLPGSHWVTATAGGAEDRLKKLTS